MIPIYQESSDSLQIDEIRSAHFPPHLHKSIEIIYVTEGSLVMGVGIDLYELHKGDLGIVFPNLIHHYQVFSPGENRHIVLLASPSYFGSYEQILTTFRPSSPVIPANELHPDIAYALNTLIRINRKDRHVINFRPDEKAVTDPAVIRASETLVAGNQSVLNHAFLQIILARALPALTLCNRIDLKKHDIVYQTVAYVSAHYQEDISLGSMADALGISPYALSRVFSGSFHQNFNHYLNDVRLEHASVLLADSDLPITEIYLECGFQSQATFNRVFRTKYKVTPRQYRKASAMSH
ncbi:MAG: AraC family transcriptional regulator [Eubacteriales bacterium]